MTESLLHAPLLHWRERHPEGWYQTLFTPAFGDLRRSPIFRLVLGDRCDPLTGTVNDVDLAHRLTRYIAGTAEELTAGLLITFIESVLAEWDAGARDASPPATSLSSSGPPESNLS